MMISLGLLFVVCALISFLLSAFNFSKMPPINFQSLGFAFVTAAWLAMKG